MLNKFYWKPIKSKNTKIYFIVNHWNINIPVSKNRKIQFVIQKYWKIYLPINALNPFHVKRIKADNSNYAYWKNMTFKISLYGTARQFHTFINAQNIL